MLLQKTFTADYLTKRRVKNSDHQKQYYVKDHHEAVIPKMVYYKIQVEMAREAIHGERWQEAGEFLKKALVYPENLGEVLRRAAHAR